MAILGIVLHNFCHWLRGSVQENEYTFNVHNNQHLLYVLTHPDWDTPLQLFSFFGHYGVPVFLFLSGYGLVKKYEGTRLEPVKALPSLGGVGGGFSFIRHHYLKLFRMMIIGWVFFLIIDRLTPRAHLYELPDIVSQLFMFNNLMPMPHKAIWPGAYWFFGLMMQLYIIYRLLIYRRHWAIAVALAVLCIAIQVPFLQDYDTLSYLRYNCLSGMLPFVLGIMTARHGGKLFPRPLCGWHWAALFILGTMLMLLWCLHPFLWLLVPVAMIPAGVDLVKLLPHPLLNAMTWTGTISAAMFVAHPALRKLFLPIALRGDIYAGLALYLISTFVVAWLFMLIINKKTNRNDDTVA